METKIIQELLSSVGVFSCYAGYRYFIDAVCMAAANPEKLLNIRKEIYVQIADTYDVQISSVEKDLRTIRDVLMKNEGALLLKRLTGSGIWQTRQPYPREVICIFAGYLSGCAAGTRS